jgi:hypothetical protein
MINEKDIKESKMTTVYIVPQPEDENRLFVGVGVVHGGFNRPITGKCRHFSFDEMGVAPKATKCQPGLLWGQPRYSPVGHRNDVGESNRLPELREFYTPKDEKESENG